jgi:LysR family hydrogen peroxide-inducible transcriptional activator
MEVHQLRYFVAVVQEGGFSRAAEVAHVAQPSLSQQIQKLEAELGQRLFDRLSRGVSLTEAGHKLLPFARRILSDLGDALRCVEESQREVGGTVTLGIIPTVAPYILRSLLTTLRSTQPAVTLQVRENVTEALVRGLENGELDMAMVSTCRNAPGLLRECLTHEPLWLTLPKNHAAAKKKWASLEVLRQEPFLSLDETHCLSQQIGSWCRRHQIRRRSAQPVVQLSTIVAMVAAGQGVSLIPAMAEPHEKGKGCTFLSLRALAPHREINILRNPARFQSRSAAAVAVIARQTVLDSIASANQRGTEK